MPLSNSSNNKVIIMIFVSFLIFSASSYNFSKIKNKSQRTGGATLYGSIFYTRKTNVKLSRESFCNCAAPMYVGFKRIIYSNIFFIRTAITAAMQTRAAAEKGGNNYNAISGGIDGVKAQSCQQLRSSTSHGCFIKIIFPMHNCQGAKISKSHLLRISFSLFFS